MASADQFLRLLEEKDLVSAQVLAEARRELQRRSPPPDAVGLSLWLVQGQHITSSQAERLLATVLAQPEEKSILSRWQKGEPRSAETARAQSPAAIPPKAPESQIPETTEPANRPTPPATSASHDLDLAPEEDNRGSSKKTVKPAPTVTSPSASAVPGPSSPPQPPGMALDDLDIAPDEDYRGSSKKAKPASTPSKTADSVDFAELTESASAAPTEIYNEPSAVGGSWDPLENSMGGPLDSLLEGEVSQPESFESSVAPSAPNPPAAKKFKLSRFLRNLFGNRSKVVAVKAADPRQVKLVLFSWGLAVFMLVGALWAFWCFSPADSAEILRKAEEKIAKKDYASAIALYDDYLKNYGQGAQGDEVRVLRVLMEIRRANEKATGSGDWRPAFDVAEEQVKKLPKNRPPELMQKVGVALAQVGEGLAVKAQMKPDKPSLDRLLAITNTIEAVVPADVRPLKMLEQEIAPALRQCKQAVERQAQVEQLVAAIRGAVADNDLPSAYKAYQDVLRSYPDLAEQPEMIAAMKEVAETQRKAVQPGRQSLAATRGQRPSDLLAAMPLAVQSVRGELPAMRNKLRLVVDQGTVYGLSAATGKVLWRRFVARDPQLPPVTATPIAEASATDAVLCDPVHKELIRVNGSTGELVWRLAVAQAIVAEPVRAGNWLLLLTKDQRLLLIDLDTGDASRYLRLPQSVRLPPVVDAAHGLVYLVAEQSNVYVLAYGEGGGSAKTGTILQCRQVLHLGHEAGAIAAAPSVVGDYLLIPVNDSPNEATVRVLSIPGKAGADPFQLVEQIGVKGSIVTPPAAVGGRAVIVTAQGGIVALDRSESGEAPFRPLVRVEPALDERVARFLVSDGQTFWVTGKELTRYAIKAGEGRVVSQATSDQGAKFLESPAIYGGTLFYSVQKPGLPGVTVSAVNLATGDQATGEPVWQTWLAAPLAAAPMQGSVTGKLTAVTASGGMFLLPPDGLRPAAVPVEPILSVDAARLSKPLCSLLSLPGERYALSSGADTSAIAIYDPQEQDQQFRWLVSPHEMAAVPAAFGGGVLTACVNGQVFLLDPTAREESMARPYSISLPGVSRWNWRSPQPVNDKLAVLCDGDRRMIAIALGGVPSVLTEAAAAPLPKAAMVSPVAASGNSVYVADADGNLLSFVLPGLLPGKTNSLGGRCVWGPQAVGKLVLVATDKDQLFALDGRQHVVWRAELKYGPLAGAPLSAGTDIYLAAQSGIVWRVSAADGRERGKSDAGCPLGSGPLLAGSRLIVGGHDGSLLEVKKP